MDSPSYCTQDSDLESLHFSSDDDDDYFEDDPNFSTYFAKYAPQIIAPKKPITPPDVALEKIKKCAEAVHTKLTWLNLNTNSPVCKLKSKECHVPDMEQFPMLTNIKSCVKHKKYLPRMKGKGRIIYKSMGGIDKSPHVFIPNSPRLNYEHIDKRHPHKRYVKKPFKNYEKFKTEKVFSSRSDNSFSSIHNGAFPSRNQEPSGGDKKRISDVDNWRQCHHFKENFFTQNSTSLQKSSLDKSFNKPFVCAQETFYGKKPFHRGKFSRQQPNRLSEIPSTAIYPLKSWKNNTNIKTDDENWHF